MLWHPERRAQLAAFNSRRGSEALQLIAHAREMAEGRSAADLRLLVSAYVQGVCSFHDHLQHEIRDVTNAAAIRSGFVPPGETLFDDSRAAKPHIVAELCPELAEALYAARSNGGLEEIPLLEPCPNELADSSLPLPMNMLLHRPSRPPVSAYASEDAVLYAHPFRYQLLSRDRSAMWSSGSPRPLTRAAIGEPEVVRVGGDVVVLQDRFNATNFSHFLFDSVGRALLLDQRFDGLRSALLVFGGVPGEFHETVCTALSAVLGLDAANIFFPDRPVIVETPRRCIWFSDQVEAYLHPAQMAHPVSVGRLRTVVEAIPGDPPGPRRVYISRGDAEQRRVVNEVELSLALLARGFATVEMSRLSIAQQIGLFRDAEIVVAPHGMGLTHLAAAEQLAGIVELFSPTIGSDAYALIAKAGGIDHAAIIGTATGSPVGDFTVVVDQVMRRLDLMAGSGARPAWRKPANLLPGSKSFAGFAAEEDAATAGVAVPELIWGNRVRHHRADEPGERIVGRRDGVPVISGLRYAASCWVWLPAGFAGEALSLRLRDGGDPHVAAADPARRDAWQRIWTSAVAASSRLAIELHLASPGASAFVSTCWQLERGDKPSAYVATG